MRPNPKDEAIELVNKFKLGDVVTEKLQVVNINIYANLCALIAVDLLIANEHLETGDESWWKRVKQELLKL